MRISDWSSDVCSSDLNAELRVRGAAIPAEARGTIAVDAFCDLAPRDDIDAAIETAERNLAAAGQQDAVREARLFEPLTLPGLDVDALVALLARDLPALRSEEHTSELQSLMRISDAVFCLKKKKK